MRFHPVPEAHSPLRIAAAGFGYEHLTSTVAQRCRQCRKVDRAASRTTLFSRFARGGVGAVVGSPTLAAPASSAIAAMDRVLWREFMTPLAMRRGHAGGAVLVLRNSTFELPGKDLFAMLGVIALPLQSRESTPLLTVFRIPLSVTSTRANCAPSLAGVHESVLRCELVTLFTMGSAIGCNGAPGVFGAGHRLKMIGIDTCAVAAYVVNCETFRNLPDIQFVAEAMRPAVVTSHCDHAIPRAIFSPNP